MPMLPITSFYAAILALFALKLAFNVIKMRQFHKEGLGYGQKDLLLAGRIHANAMEYIPIGLILLGLAEINGIPHLFIHIAGASLLIARVMHAKGFKAGRGRTHPGRYWGTVTTWLVLVFLSLLNLLYSWPYL